MAKWVHSDVLDNGLNAIKSNANSMRLLSNYTAADSYATVVGNTIGGCTVSMASGDYTLGTSSSNRTLTTASGKSATASATVTPTNSHIAFVDTVNSKVLWVTDESSEQTITNGNTVNFPALVYTAQQPT